jgi:hypothetical protein
VNPPIFPTDYREPVGVRGGGEGGLGADEGPEALTDTKALPPIYLNGSSDSSRSVPDPPSSPSVTPKGSEAVSTDSFRCVASCLST